MYSIAYKLLSSDDAESYHQIRLECLDNYPDFFGDTYEEELTIGTNRFQKEFVCNESYSFLYGAFLEGLLVGICGFIQQKRIKTKHRGDLVQVYTTPAFVGYGIGSKLVKLTIEKAFENDQIDQIFLSVVSANTKAINIYKKFGFVPYGLINNYFKRDNYNWSQLFMALTRESYAKQGAAKIMVRI